MTSITSKIISSTKTTLDHEGKQIAIYDIRKLDELGLTDTDKLPYSIRVLLENALRNYDGFLVTEEAVNTIANWPEGTNKKDIPYMPARVILQDFTGVPLIVDLAAMRDAMKEHGGDPEKINPMIPTDLVIDHSVQVDSYGSADSLSINLGREYERNNERYKLIKWAQKAFKNFQVVPPGSGIVHQVNLEYLATVAEMRDHKGELTGIIDTCLGTDSHTTMINGLGVMGWGVGGIEAEAVMLGQPYYMLLPEVIGFKLTGQLPEGATATDLVLTVVEMLRKKGVVAKFVEFYGTALSTLTLPDRATISNMSPEYGATMGFFPIDDVTLGYLRLTGRDESHIEFVKKYARKLNIFRTDESPDPTFSDTLELDMSTVKPSLAGPLNPDELVSLEDMQERAIEYQENHISSRSPDAEIRSSKFEFKGQEVELTDGNIVIAAITSCTNTSNPSVMIGSAMIARNAVKKGLMTKPYVKTSFAPGSLVVTEYIKNLNLQPYLDELGFQTVGYGCTTCIGNSGPLPLEIDKSVRENDLYVTSVLSGNRNFAGRVHSLTRGNFLASPMLVVAYALAGRTDIDLITDPLGQDQEGKDVFLKDLWPSQNEILEAVEKGLNPKMFTSFRDRLFAGDFNWQSLTAPESTLFDWDPNSTYARLPPFFDNFTLNPNGFADIKSARVLLLLDDKISTDHISPAGAIAADSPAGKYLVDHSVEKRDFNSYGSRRGNHEVMMRGTFANVRVKNQLVPHKEGWWTKYIPDDDVTDIFDASRKYIENQIPVIAIGGAQYGQGSSRDWAAKGPALLGIKAVFFKSIERIHRSNLIGMGVLPLEFKEGQGWRELGLDGSEAFDITGVAEGLTPSKQLSVKAIKNDGSKVEFEVTARIDTDIEVEYFRFGGILNYVLAQLLTEA
ncbi:MAG: aconitate hydratase AcnA [Candidatus Heimdallarchaeota archaeon]|nr:aconitate hydratase AcnA [Candidatus Heimdallarchaeota archaeon]